MKKAIYFWLLATLLFTYISGNSRCLLINYNNNCKITERIYSSASGYDCIGWNVFLNVPASKNTAFFFVRHFYFRQDSLKKEVMPEKSTFPGAYTLTRLHSELLNITSQGITPLQHEVLLYFDSLVIIKGKEIYLFKETISVELFLLDQSKQKPAKTDYYVINQAAKSLSYPTGISRDSLIALLNADKKDACFQHKSMYLLSRRKDSLLYFRTYQPCSHCGKLYCRIFTFTPGKGITNFFSSYLYGPRENIIVWGRVDESSQLYWFE